MSLQHLPIDRIWCQEVIISTTKRAGDGTLDSPIRVITEVFLKNGKLIAKYDPIKDEGCFESKCGIIKS